MLAMITRWCACWFGRGAIRSTFAAAAKNKPRKRPFPAIGLADGSWSARIRGSIALVGFWSAGRRRSSIIWLFFIWLVLNSFFTKFRFSDKVLWSHEK